MPPALPAAPAAFDRRASAYERRWRRYNQATHDLVLGQLSLSAGAAVLDVGCGTGLLLERLLEAHPDLQPTGADPSAAMLEQARLRLQQHPNVTLVQAHAAHLPFPPERFDGIVSASALHFFPDPRAALSEMWRVMRPEGCLVLLDWDGDSPTMRLLDLWLRIWDRAHVRLYGREALEQVLHEAGFTVGRVTRHRWGWWHFITVTACASAP